MTRDDQQPSAHSILDPQPGKVPILVDGRKLIAPSRRMTGAQLRALPQPPIGSDRDLWLDAAGDLDELVADDQPVDLEPQMRLFTVPRVINPGCTV